MDHSHHQCQHVFAFCERCDVPYCTVCKREWNTNTLWIKPSYPAYPYWSLPTPITSADVTLTASGSHAHN